VQGGVGGVASQVLPAQCSPASHELLAVAQIQLQRFLLSGGTCGKHALDLLTHHPIFAFGACIHSRHVRLRRLSECSDAQFFSSTLAYLDIHSMHA